jgi:hypothetical protein
MYAPRSAAPLGAWYNNWGDLWGDITGLADKVTGQTGPVGSPVTQAAAENQRDADTIAAWSTATKAAGQVPTRAPSMYGAAAGLLCARVNGPGTKYPNDTSSPVYIIAPQNVLEADARLQGQIAQDQTGRILEFLKGIGLAPGIAGYNANPPFDFDVFKQYMLYAGIGLAALVL